CPSDFHLALKAIGKILSQFFGIIPKSHNLQDLSCPLINPFFSCTVSGGLKDHVEKSIAQSIIMGDPNVVQDRHLGPKPDVLKCPGYPHGCHLMRVESPQA